MLYLAAYTLFGLFIAPIVIRIDFAYQKSLTGAVNVSVWGFKIMFHFEAARDEAGKPALIYYRNGSLKRHNRSAGNAISMFSKVVKVLFKGNIAFKLLEKSVTVMRLRGVVRVSLKDAAQTALMAAFLQEGMRIVSHVLNGRHITHAFRIWPDFSAKGSACQGNCILFVRLGNLALVSLLIGILMRRDKKEKLTEEEEKWNTPLET